MKALIVHAGRTGGPYPKTEGGKIGLETMGWADGSPPKGLHHFRGEVLLERTVRILRDYGVNPIRLVAGYKIDMLRQFNEEKGLGLEIVENPNYAVDVQKMLAGRPLKEWDSGYQSVKMGLNGYLDDADDLLITFGDVWMLRFILNEMLASSNPFVMSMPSLFLIRQPFVKELANLDSYGDQSGVHKPLWKFMEAHKCDVATGIADIDYYNQTDEYKKEECQRLHSEGLDIHQIGAKMYMHPRWVKLMLEREGCPLFYPIADEYIFHPPCMGCTLEMKDAMACSGRKKIIAMRCPRERVLLGEPYG